MRVVGQNQHGGQQWRQAKQQGDAARQVATEAGELQRKEHPGGDGRQLPHGPEVKPELLGRRGCGRQLHQLAERPQRQEQADKGKRLRPRHQPPPPAGDAQGHEQEHRAQADANDGTQGVAGVHVVDGGQ